MPNTSSKNIKKDQKYVNILGINILSTTELELLAGIRQKITDSVKFDILTPNPELVLASTKNNKLKEALNSATFSVPDGVGLKFATKFLYDKSLNVIPGRELFVKLIDLAAELDLKVFLLGGKDNEAVLTAEAIITKYPLINISTSKGPTLKNDGENDAEVVNKVYLDIVKRINNYKPDLLFVAFGNPKQELWIHNNLHKLDIKGAMAVGGTFRYIAGLSKLPPKWMEGWGEWLWRLVTEPKRFLRVWNAVVIFPLRLVVTKWFLVAR